MVEIKIDGKIVSKRLRNVSEFVTELLPGTVPGPDEDEPTIDAFYTVQTPQGLNVTVHKKIGFLGLISHYLKFKVGKSVSIDAYYSSNCVDCNSDSRYHALGVKFN